MKSIKQILKMLTLEVDKYADKINSNHNLKYYNEVSGDTSFLVAGLLGSLLKSKLEWCPQNWIDDSILTDISIQEKMVIIEGVVIWGKANTLQQWTSPFHFQYFTYAENDTRFKFLFCDVDHPAITYEVFNMNRDYWTSDRVNWRFVINSEEIEID